MHFKSFSEIADYLDDFSYRDKSLAPGALRGERLDRMHLILERLGNPERSFRSYHFAGSKGKGSTAAFLSSCLEAAGERCGLYLSPHLIDYRERFTLAGKFFPEETYIKAADKVYEAMKEFSVPEGLGSRIPSTFEMYTAYAYMLFKEAGCTAACIETGLGGRLDATNTLLSEASILTPIELEHTQILGDTITKIAGEKAKIIKEGRPCFVSYQKEDARRVFEQEAAEKHSPITFLSDEVLSIDYEEREDVSHCSATFKDGEHFSLDLRMRGRVQAENAVLALMVSRKLGFYNGKTIDALENTRLPGRFEGVDYKGHRLVFDVAHTKNSIDNTIRTFDSIYRGRSNVLLFAAIDGKDTYSMLSLLLPSFERIIISRPGIYKISYPERTYEMARRLAPDKEIHLIEDARAALEKALELSGDGAILITGSFYLAGAIEEVL